MRQEVDCWDKMPKITLHRKQIGLISTYPPRKCGIATFAADLYNALNAELSSQEHLSVIAINDGRKDYTYPEHVPFKIRDKNLSDYYRAAEFLNTYCDIVILQHEFKIFGGPSGFYIIELLNNLEIPIITTIHTVQFNPPNNIEKQVLTEIGILSDEIIVMTNTAKTFLIEIYGIPAEKISIIPHGIHDVPFIEDTSPYKEQLKLDNRKIILTFGLLNKLKGIEYVIEAMPQIIKEHEDTLYIILGRTQRRIHELDGEQYRNMLQKRVKTLNLENHVRFYNQFIPLKQLLKFLIAADVYTYPSLNKDFTGSGTLSYALGTGNAVISTPFHHAKEYLADGRGILVPFQDSQAIAQALLDLFASDSARNELRKNAYRFTRSMTWQKVGYKYLNTIRHHLESQKRNIMLIH